MKTAACILLILMFCFVLAAEDEDTALAQQSSFGLVNPQTDRARLDADWQKFTQDHMTKYRDEISKCGADPFKRQEIQIKSDYDFNMKHLEYQKKLFELQTGKRL